MTITDNLRDAAYIVIGMGVIGVQRAQVRREEMRKQFAGQRSAFEDAVRQADATVNKLIAATPAGPVVAELRSRLTK